MELRTNSERLQRFENRQDANKAIERLVSAGVHRSDISLVEGAGGVTVQPSPSDEATGFWESLKICSCQVRTAPRTPRACAGADTSSRCGQAQRYTSKLDILDDEGTIDINERATSWREEGGPATAPTRGP